MYLKRSKKVFSFIMAFVMVLGVMFFNLKTTAYSSDGPGTLTVQCKNIDFVGGNAQIRQGDGDWFDLGPFTDQMAVQFESIAPVTGPILKGWFTVRIIKDGVTYREKDFYWDGKSDLKVNLTGEKTVWPVTGITIDAASRTEYYVGDTLDLDNTIVTATYEDGSSKAVTGFTMATQYTAAENNPYSGTTNPEPKPTDPMTLYITGNRTVTVSYTENGVTQTADFTVHVAGYRVYDEYEFDLTGQPLTFATSFNYKILNLMKDGKAFNKTWFTYGTVINVYYETVGASAEPDMRLALLQGLSDEQLADWSKFQGNSSSGYQKRIQSTLDIRDMNDFSWVAGNPPIGRGLVDNVSHTLQGKFEQFYRENGIAPYMPDLYQYLCVFGGTTSRADAYKDFTLLKVTLGWTDPNTAAPWADDYQAPTVTGITVSPANPSVMRGDTTRLTAAVSGTNNPPQSVTWKVLNGNASRIIDGYLTVGSSEASKSLTVRAASVFDPSVYSDVTVNVLNQPSTLAVPSYYELEFNYENRWQDLPNMFGTRFQCAALSRNNLVNNSTEFQTPWFQPGTVYTFRYSLVNGATDADVLNALRIGITPLGGNAGASPTQYVMTVSQNPDDRDTALIIDLAAHTIQGTFEAFAAAGGNIASLVNTWTDSVNEASAQNHHYFAIAVGVINSITAGAVIHIDKATIGITDIVGNAPWHTVWDVPALSADHPVPAPLPSGNNGLAAKYPGDVGILNDPDVVRADDFSGADIGRITDVSQLKGKWNSIRLQTNFAWMYIVGKDQTTFTGGGPADGKPVAGTSDMPGDKAAVLYTNSDGSEGNFSIELQNHLADSEALDTAFIRYYANFAPNFSINGSSHNGVTASAMDRERLTDGSYNSTNWLITNGYDFYNTMYEFNRDNRDPSFRSPGESNVYIYYPGQSISDYGDHFFADGTRVGGTFIPNYGDAVGGISPHFTPIITDRSMTGPLWPQDGVWHCYELMIKANTVVDGVVQRDGRVACWMDGQLIMDFPNLVVRYTEELKMNISRCLLINSPNLQANGYDTYKMVSNYVLADSYIGPITQIPPEEKAQTMVMAAQAAANQDLSSAANLNAAKDAYAKALEAVDALAPSEEKDLMTTQLMEIKAKIDIYNALTNTGIAKTAIEAGTYAPVSVEWDNNTTNMLTDALSQVKAMATGLGLTGITSMTAAFDAAPIITDAGVPAANYVINMQLTGSDGSYSTAVITVNVTFSALVDNAAYRAKVAIQETAFDDITIVWNTDQAHMLADAQAAIKAAVEALALPGITVTGVTFKSPPAITVAGLAKAAYGFSVNLAGDDASVTTASITVNVTFGEKPQLIPVYKELDFVLPANTFIYQYATIPLYGLPLTISNKSAAIMSNGLSFQKSWLVPGVIATIYYTTNGVAAPGNLRFALQKGQAYRIEDNGGRTYTNPAEVASDASWRTIIDQERGTLKVKVEALYNNAYTRNFISLGGYDAFCPFTGSASFTDFTIARVTLGMADPDAIPPWDPNYVPPTAPTSVAIDQDNLLVSKGQDIQLSATVTGPDGCYTDVAWGVYGTSIPPTNTLTTTTYITKEGFLHIGTGETSTTLTVKAGSSLYYGTPGLTDTITITIAP